MKFLNHFKKSRPADPLEIKIIQARHSFFAFLWDGSVFVLKKVVLVLREAVLALSKAFLTRRKGSLAYSEVIGAVHKDRASIIMPNSKPR